MAEKVKLKALKKFPHEGSMVRPGDTFEVTPNRVRLYVKSSNPLAELASGPSKRKKRVEVPPPVELEQVQESAKADDQVESSNVSSMQTYSTRDMKADS